MRIILFILLCFSAFVSAKESNTNNTVNRQKIIVLTNNYILLLQETINQKSDNYFGKIGLCFEDFTINDHVYDLSNEHEKLFVGAYFSDAKNSRSITQFDSNTTDLEIIPCTYFNSQTSRNYAYVRLPKKVTQAGKEKSYDHILAIDITNATYFIDEVYEDNAVTYQKYIAPCKNEAVNSAKHKELANIIEKKFTIISNFYSNKKYLEAMVLVEEVLELNPSHVPSIDAKDAMLNLIKPSAVEKKITYQLSQNNIKEANETYKLAKKYAIGSASDFDFWAVRISKKSIQIKQEFEFDKAENFYANEMFQRALSIYYELQNAGFQNSLLLPRIKACKEADPDYIKDKIKKAYNAAVSSKRFMPSTFKIYYKYENSGNLNGGNFRFMCQMMLSRGNKKLLREMNISPNQAKNLAIKYFYNAQSFGKDMRDIEFMIFTKNFNKN